LERLGVLHAGRVDVFDLQRTGRRAIAAPQLFTVAAVIGNEKQAGADSG